MKKQVGRGMDARSIWGAGLGLVLGATLESLFGATFTGQLVALGLAGSLEPTARALSTGLLYGAGICVGLWVADATRKKEPA